MDLDMGNIGTTFLSADMLLTLLVQEGTKNEKGKGKEKAKEAGIVTEAQPEEEMLTAEMEASMALALLHSGAIPEDGDKMVEGDEVIEEVSEFDVTLLHPVIVDGEEFLFLDDIVKTLGLREDEALSILAKTSGLMDPENPRKDGDNFEIDFTHEPVTKELAFRAPNVEPSLEATVVSALVTIKDQAAFYEGVPEAAFQPHKPLVLHATEGPGSIDLFKGHMKEADDASETAMEIDRFATRSGGIREGPGGRDSSLWHYLPALNASILRVFHMNFSGNGHAEILKCKALSGVLNEDPLTANANKCILVNRSAALHSFAGKYPGSLLAHCALSLAQGIEDPSQIVKSLGEGTSRLPITPERFQELIKKL